MIFRLGADFALRLPRTVAAADKVEKEWTWLPRLRPLLPLTVSEPVARGAPSEAYPLPWLIFRWHEGHDANGHVLDAAQAGRLGAFVRAMRAIDLEGGPPPGAHNSRRGVPLADRDRSTRAAAEGLIADYDAVTLLHAWEAARDAPAWLDRGRWIHGDLIPGNVLLAGQEIVAVIDFGTLGVGDPACDLMPGWTLCDAASRPAFRLAADADDAMWARGRGWALSWGLIALPYYRDSNPALAASARRTIGEVLADAAP